MNIGFVSTRLAGADGVSLETAKWAAVLRRLGHQVFYCAGELEAGGPPGKCIPEMHFRHPQAMALGQRAFGRSERDPTLLDDIARQAEPLRAGLREFVNNFGIELLVVENALAIPMHLPLGLALAELIAETGLPAIAHHHDFYWERERFQSHCLLDFLDNYFPFDAPNVKHVVINSLAQRDLKARRGIDSVVVPNVFDFATPAPGIDDFNADFRQVIGLAPGDLLFLQPTRVVRRKGIELAIELVHRLQAPSFTHHASHFTLVITHPAGDEGLEYLHELQVLAEEAGVDLRYVADRMAPQRGIRPGGGKIYSLWDAYIHADFVTYPSLYEGFGNALIEAVYFRKPVLVNRYPVYAADIGPLGFEFVEIDGRITDETVAQVRALLADPCRREAMAERNYRLGQEHFSFERLEELLQGLLGGGGEGTF